MNGYLTAALAALMLVMIVAPAALADVGEVWMSDFLLLRVRCPVAGYSVEERVAEIENRANDLLFLDGIDLSKVRVEKKGQDAVIFAGDAVLITVTQCDAKANKTTPQKLATAWVQRLREIYPDVVPKKPLLAPLPSPPPGG